MRATGRSDRRRRRRPTNGTSPTIWCAARCVVAVRRRCDRRRRRSSSAGSSAATTSSRPSTSDRRRVGHDRRTRRRPDPAARPRLHRRARRTYTASDDLLDAQSLVAGNVLVTMTDEGRITQTDLADGSERRGRSGSTRRCGSRRTIRRSPWPGPTPAATSPSSTPGTGPRLGVADAAGLDDPLIFATDVLVNPVGDPRGRAGPDRVPVGRDRPRDRRPPRPSPAG